MADSKDIAMAGFSGYKANKILKQLENMKKIIRK